MPGVWRVAKGTAHIEPSLDRDYRKVVSFNLPELYRRRRLEVSRLDILRPRWVVVSSQSLKLSEVGLKRIRSAVELWGSLRRERSVTLSGTGSIASIARIASPPRFVLPSPHPHLLLLAQRQSQGKCANTVSYHGGGLVDGGLVGGGPGGMGGFGGAGGGKGTAAGQTPLLPALG